MNLPKFIRNSSKGTRGFTLIELLVVIAIIAILAAILFPVFAQAKASAKKTASLSNMKQTILGVMMYTNDYDDKNSWHYGWSRDFPAQVYYNDTTWVNNTAPYIKNRDLHFDATVGMPKEDATTPDGRPAFFDPFYPSFRYRWGWVANLSINSDGFSTNGNGDCYANRQANIGSTNTRVLSSIESPAERLAITPSRYANLSYSWMYYQSRWAMTPFKDAYFTSDFSWFNLVWDSRRQWEGRFNAAFADGHVGRFGPDKFVGACLNGGNCVPEFTSTAQLCDIYNSREDLKKFWGVWN